MHTNEYIQIVRKNIENVLAQLDERESEDTKASAADDAGVVGARDLLRREAEACEDKAAESHALLSLARTHMAEGDERNAVKSVLKAILRGASSPAVWYTALGVCRFERARRELERLYQQLGSQIEPALARAAIALQFALEAECEGNYDEASNHYRYAASIDSSFEAAIGELRTSVGAERWLPLGNVARQLALEVDDSQTRASLLVLAALTLTTETWARRASWLLQAAKLARTPALLAAAVGVASHSEEAPAIEQSLAELTGDTSDINSAPLLLLASLFADRLSDDSQAAVELAARAYELAPEIAPIADWLIELCERSGDFAQAATIMARRVEHLTRDSERVEMLVRIAELRAGELEDMDGAVVALERAVKIDPLDSAALQALGQLYIVGERWEALVQMHLLEAEHVPRPAVRAQALYRAASIYAERLDRVEAAIELLEQAVQLDARFTPATRLLERIYRAADRFAPLVELYRTELAGTKQRANRIALLEHIAVLLDTRLDDHDAAIETYEELLDLDPTNLPALRALERLRAQKLQWLPALSALRGQVALASGPRDRSGLLLRMGQILEERLQAYDDALVHYGEALSVHSTSETYEAMGRLLHRTKAWSALLQLTEQQLTETRDVHRRVALAFKAARLLEEEMQQPERAILAYGRVLDLDPDYAPALRALSRIGRRDQRRDALQRLLLADSGDDQRRAHAWVSIAIHMGAEPFVAEDALARAAEAKHDDQLVAVLEIASAAARHRWERVAAALPALYRPVIALGQRRKVDALEAAKGLDDTDLAALRWKDWLACANGEPRSSAATGRLAREQAPWRSEVVVRLVRLLDDDQERVEVARAVVDDPTSRMRELFAVALGLADREGDALQLREAAIRRLVQLATDDTTRAELLVDAGLVAARRGDDDAAMRAWIEALELDSACRGAYGLARDQAARRDDDDALLRVLSAGTDQLADPSARAADLVRRAELYERKGDSKACLADLQQAATLDPSSQASWTLLRLLREAGDREALAAHLGVMFDAVADEDKLHVGLDLVDLYQEAGQPREACEFAIALVCDHANDPRVVFRAALLQAESSAISEALVLMRRLCDDDRHAVAVAARNAVGLLSQHSLGDAAAAIEAYESTLELDDSNLVALRGLADIEAMQPEARYERLESLCARLAELEHPEQRANALQRLAHVRLGRSGVVDDGVLEPLAAAVECGSPTEQLLDFVTDTHRQAGRLEVLVELLGRVEVDDSQRQAQVALERGKALFELGRAEEAQEQLRQALSLGLSEDEEAVELVLRSTNVSGVEDDDIDELVALHSKMLQAQPLKPRYARQLVELLDRQGRHDDVFCVRSALMFLSETTREDEYFYKRQKRLVPAHPTGKLDQDDIDALIFGDANARQLARLLRVLAPFVDELLPQDLGAYGLGSEPLGSDVVPATIVACAAAVGEPDADVYIASGGASGGVVEPGRRPRIVLPPHFHTFSVPQQRFLAGRLLARVATRVEISDPYRSDPVRPRDLALLIEAARGETESSDRVLADVRRRLASLDEQLLAQSRELANALDVSTDALQTWLDQVELGAFKLGVLMAGSLQPVAAILERSATHITDRTKGALVSFVVSEEHARLRAKMGMRLEDG